MLNLGKPERMMDSLESTASDDTQDQTALVDADAQDSSEADNKPAEPDVNQDALRASLEAARLQGDVADLKRATGHIRGMQSKVDSIERSLAKITDLEQSNQQLASRFDTLIDALVDANLVTDRAGQSLRPQRGDSTADIMAKIDGLIEKQTAGPATVEDPDTSGMAAADVATAKVYEYAKGKGYDANQIPDAIWTTAFNTNRGDLMAATLDVMRYVEAELAKQGRREEKRDAATGGTGERSARKGALTLSQLKAMSVAEVGEYDKANPGVIDKVMAGK